MVIAMKFCMVYYCIAFHIYVFSIMDYIDCVLTILMPLFSYPAMSAASVF